MFCKNCGSPLKDGAKFCINCGTKVDQEEVKPEVKSIDPQPEEQINAAPAPAPETPAAVPQAEPAPAAPQKAKKKKKKLVPILIVAAIVAVLAVLVIFNFAKITNFFAKTFMKPDSYYHFVENRNADILAQNIADVYSFGLFNNVENDNIKQDYSLKAELSDGGRDFLYEFFRVDMPWLKSAMVKLSNNKKDGVNAPKIELFLNGESITGADAIVDGNKYSIRLHDFSEKYFNFDFNELFHKGYSKPEYYDYEYYDSDYYGSSSVGNYAGDYDYGYGYDDYDYYAYPETGSSRSMKPVYATLMSDFSEMMPDRETIRNLISKYLKIALGELDGVEKGKSTLSACGVSNEYTTLEITIDEKAVQKMATAVLKELKKDPDVKKILKDFEKTFENDEIYEEFIESINEALDNIDEIEFDEKIKMTVWVGSSGEVVGREITVKPYGSSETIVFKMAMPVKGNKFGAEISYGLKGEDPFAILSGSGTVKSNKMTGDFKLSTIYTYYEYIDDGSYWGYNIVERTKNVDMLKFSTENFDIKEVFNGHLKGKFTFEIPEDMLSILFEEIEEDPNGETADLIKKLKLVIDADISNKNGSLGVKIVHSNETYLNLVYSYGTGAAEKINKDVDSISAEKYGETVDFETGLDKIANKLKKAGMPAELVEKLIDELSDEGGKQNYNSYDDTWDW